MLISSKSLPRLGMTVCLFWGGIAASLFSQEISKPFKMQKHYVNSKGKKVPVPQPSHDGFFRDSDNKIRLAKRHKMNFSSIWGEGAEASILENGLLSHNRHKIGERIKTLESEKVEKLYLDSTDSEIIVSVVVRNKKNGNAVLLTAIGVTLSMLEESDVNQAKVVVYLGENWVDVKGQEQNSGWLKRNMGPMIAMSRVELNDAEKNKVPREE